MSLNLPQFIKSKFGSWLFLLFFLWVVVVVVEFFIHCPEVWWSLPLSLPKNADLSKFLKVLGEFSRTILLSVWFLALVGWTGHRVFKVLGLEQARGIMVFCLKMGFGIFFWTVFWLGLGLTRLWFGPLWLGAIVLISLWAVPDLFKAIQHLRQMERPRFPSWFWALILIYGLAALIHGLLPDVFYDSLNYFLGLPQFWIYQHGITDNAQQLLSGYFYGGSMFFMGGWMLADTEGAVLLSAAVWGLCGVLAYGWTEELSDKKTAVLAAAAVLTFPLLYLNGWAVRVDGLLAFVSLLFIYAFTQALSDVSGRRRSWLFLAALFAGLAASIKPTAIVVIAAVFLITIFRREKKMGGEWGFTIFSFGFWSLLLVGPWFLKNWAFAGNPFFPYAYAWMGGRSLPLNGYHRLLWENQQSLPMDHGLWSWINLFWRLSMPGEGNNQIIGPLVLAFLPGLFLFKLKENQKFLVWVTVVSFVLGFALSNMLRFSMPAFLLAFILFSAVFLMKETPVMIQWSWKISVWVFAVFFLGAYAVISAQYYPGWNRWTGQESREDYLSKTMSNSYEPLALWADKNLSADARLLIVGDARGLYYPRFFYANSVFDEPFLVRAVRQEKKAAGILKKLHQEGITHVVVNGLEGLRLSADYRQYEMAPAEWAALNDLMARGLKPLYWKNFQAVYEVKDKLSQEKTPHVLNLFSFLPPTAYDFSQAVQAGDKVKARAALLEQIKLFPQEPYWRTQLKTQ